MSAQLAQALVASLDEAALRELAAALAPFLPTGDQSCAGDEWLDVDRAAAYLSCQPKRIYDLRSQGRIRFAKDGSRLLFRRSWLDAYLEESA